MYNNKDSSNFNHKIIFININKKKKLSISIEK